MITVHAGSKKEKESLPENKESVLEDKDAANQDTKLRRKRGRPRGPNFCKKARPHGKISFEELGKTIGAAWKELSSKELVCYQELAEKDRERYQKDKTAYDSELKVLKNLEKEISKSQAEKQRVEMPLNQEDINYYQYKQECQSNSLRQY